MSMKETYEKKLQAQLDIWSAEIDKLKARADAAKADTQLRYSKEIEEMRLKQEAAREKLEQLRQSSGDAWEDIKTGAESAWLALSESIKVAKSRFK